MSAEQNKATVIRLLKKLDNEAVDALVSNDSIDHKISPGWLPGNQSLKGFVDTFTTAVPDLRAAIEDIIAEKDKVAVRLTFSGTTKSEFLGIPGGRRFMITGIGFFRVRGGKVVEHWGIMGRSESQ